ncbi:capsid protein [Nitratireductor arenosus]|nr:capsid protein [Nitratireductor arenosus]
MQAAPWKLQNASAAITPSPRTRHAELLRLCARIGYSPPGLA